MNSTAENSTTTQSPGHPAGSDSPGKNDQLPHLIMIIILSTGGVVLLAFIVTTVILIRKCRKSRRDPVTVHRTKPGKRTISGATYTDVSPLQYPAPEVARAATAEVDRRYIELHPTVQPCPEQRLQQSEMDVPLSITSPSRHIGGRSQAPSLSASSTSSQPSSAKGSHPLIALLPRREQPLARQRSQNYSCSAPVPRPRPQQANGSLLPKPSVRQAQQRNRLHGGETSPLTSDKLSSEIPGDGRGGNRVRKRQSNGDDYDYEAGSDDAFSDSSEDEAQGAASRAFGYVDMANVVQVALRTASAAVLLRQSASAPEAATGVPTGMAVHRDASYPSTSPVASAAKRQPAVEDAAGDSDCYEVRDVVATHSSGRCQMGGESSTDDDERCYYNCPDEQSTSAGPEFHALDVTPLGGNRNENELRHSNLEDQQLPLRGSCSSLRSTESSAGYDGSDYYNVADGEHNPYVNVPPISFWTTAVSAPAAEAAAAAADPDATEDDTVGGP